MVLNNRESVLQSFSGDHSSASLATHGSLMSLPSDRAIEQGSLNMIALCFLTFIWSSSHNLATDSHARWMHWAMGSQARTMACNVDIRPFCRMEGWIVLVTSTVLSKGALLYFFFFPNNSVQFVGICSSIVFHSSVFDIPTTFIHSLRNLVLAAFEGQINVCIWSQFHRWESSA